MSRFGVWQLKELVVYFSPRAGSSKGVLEYVSSEFQSFKDSNPHVLTKITRFGGYGHPKLVGRYQGDTSRVLSIKNFSKAEICEAVQTLRNLTNTKLPPHGVKKEVTPKVSLRGEKNLSSLARKSVQGAWTPFLNFTRQQ